MKAIRVHEWGGPEVMRLEEVADPKPGPGQVVIAVRATGVNPVDTYIRSGVYSVKPSLPYTPGMDPAGIVESIGNGVSPELAGKRVYVTGAMSGAYAERMLCDTSQVHLLPERVSYAEGAAIGIPYYSAYRALFFRAQAVPGEVVLVHGATGGVGIAAVQLARAAGMTVIATGGSEQGRCLLAGQGAHHVVDHHVPGHLEQVLALTEGRGVDIILEMLANVNLGRDLTVLAQGGRVVIIGSRGAVEINPRDAIVRDATILGMLLMNASERETSSIRAALFAGLENGTLHPVVGQELPLEEAPRAHHEIMESRAHGKIVLIP